MPRLLACITFFVLIFGSAVTGESNNCSKGANYFFPCINYVGGFSPKPAKDCCSGLEELNKMTKEKEGPENICQCIEDMAYVTNVPFIASRVQSLPEDCHIHLSFPISISMNCSR
ncbi:Bifunctional inhibitor/lipid-transfer protein/seed storage 2S albumin superfamily protein, putative [Theobroma cacao]|uniref:Bifunctional inhibitor/lipid-transfer protein/seed storage 2S albumin superfamily protein, putative n=1 Tax=Theobroma cacao TaxID=3641 RepID=A0A061EB03_THECC|nr:Bifunctional inhibitor/lipid-transfer protein/seed storage 2S albumin superfamily protein, putative [Theobroma cacao]